MDDPLSIYSQKKDISRVSAFIVFLYLFYLADFHLHLSYRIPIYGDIRPSLILFIIIVIATISQFYKNHNYFIKNNVYRSLLVLLLATVLTLPVVEYPGSVLRFHIPEFIRALSFFFFTVIIISDKKRFKLFLSVFIFLQIIRVLEPLYLNITEGYWGDKTFIDDNEYANRLSGAPGDVINPNELGFIIITILPYIYYLLINHKNKLYKLLGILIVPALLYALVLTMSRGAYIVVLAASFFIFIKSKHKIILLLIGLGVLLVTWSSMSFYQKDRVLSLIGYSETAQSKTASGRFDSMLSEFKLGAVRPVFGHGIGTTSEAKYHNGLGTKASHNMYAELLIEIGFVGFYFFMRFIRAIYKEIKSIKLVDEEESSGVMINLFMVNFIVFALYSINYYGLSQTYWYLFAGLVVAYSRIYTAVKP